MVCGYCITKIDLLQYPAAFQYIYTGTLHCLTTHVTLHSDHFMWPQALQCCHFFFSCVG